MQADKKVSATMLTVISLTLMSNIVLLHLPKDTKNLAQSLVGVLPIFNRFAPFLLRLLDLQEAGLPFVVLNET